MILLLGFAAMALAACDRQSGNTAQAPAIADAATPDEVPSSGNDAKSEGGFAFKIDRSHKGEGAPDFTFSGMDGKDAKLADFRGRPVLLNLWATWCGPCVAEMPTLDAVAAANAKAGLSVLAMSQDSAGVDKVAAFLSPRKFTALKPYVDPESQFGFHYATGLLPTTILYGRNGKEIARVVGAMDWQGDQANALIKELMAAS